MKLQKEGPYYYGIVIVTVLIVGYGVYMASADQPSFLTSSPTPVPVPYNEVDEAMWNGVLLVWSGIIHLAKAAWENGWNLIFLCIGVSIMNRLYAIHCEIRNKD